MIDQQSQIFPIGIGTFGVGADKIENTFSISNIDRESQLDSLLYSFSLGQNYIETSYHYGNGETLKFLARFFKKVPRDNIFITTKLYSPIEKQEDVSVQLDQALRLMKIDYVDSLNCTPIAASKLPLDTVYSFMDTQIKKGKVRFLSGSNLNLLRLKLLNEKGFKLFSMEGLYNLECKINEDLGIIDYCKNSNILFAAYQPLRRNRTAKQNYPLLVELSNKYNVSQNQIIINWLTKHKKLFILNMSSHKSHVKENIDALGLSLEADDYARLDKFRKKEFDDIQIDWENKGGIPIYKLPNQLP